MKIYITLFLLLPLSLYAQTDFEKTFKDYNVTGSITIYDLDKDLWIYSDENDSKIGTLPASTFKIINSLIALETGIIKDEKQLIKWVGIQNVDTVRYGYRPDIYKNMSLAEAFDKSAVWVHLEIAKRVGREKYKSYLKRCDYGNQDFSEPGTDFWNFGAFKISPVEQINFLKKLYEGTLPFSKRTISIVKKIMVTEVGANYVIRAKTGMGILADQSIGWWVGYVETKGNVYFFSTRIRTDSTKFSAKFAGDRKALTKSILKQLGVLDIAY